MIAFDDANATWRSYYVALSRCGRRRGRCQYKIKLLSLEWINIKIAPCKYSFKILLFLKIVTGKGPGRKHIGQDSKFIIPCTYASRSPMPGDEGSFSSGNTGEEVQQLQNHFHGGSDSSSAPNSAAKKKRNLPGTPDPNAEVVALSPTTLMATNRFVCEICNKGFQRDQNLQLHRRGHNLPWKLRQRSTTEVKKRVYICPEPTCVHHNPGRALGDLTGIKKHFSRKHGEKKWKCDKCSKKYAVQSDWKAHQKTCGTREYKCDCGTIFSRRDSFITHRAFCDALAEENSKVNQGLISTIGSNQMPDLISSLPLTTNPNTSIGISDFNSFDPKNPLKSLPQELVPMPFKSMNMAGGMFSTSSGTLFGGPRSSIASNTSSLQLSSNNSSGYNYLQDGKNNGCQLSSSAQMSATALLQKAAQMGATASHSINSPMMQKSFVNSMAGSDQTTSLRPPPPPTTVQQHNYTTSPYDHHPFPHDQTHMMGISGGGFFDPGSSSGMNDMGMLSTMFMGTDQNPGLMRNIEHNINHNERQDAMERSVIGGSRFVGRSVEGGDTMTHDFMGIGGSRAVNLHEQQQRMEMEAMSQQRVPMTNHFQQQLSLGESALDKTIWDV
ncbi:zinc finger protein GAI-ASSOCIATED FACTOR 1-like [Mercurialis annua]|uniref:zinc finger protein GAI-ASSOCIATED FACTOR 1-like n=1 Tax=Mercurialis annua TaxID=3986 RepID=UPI0024ADBA58|nr:zinc finger protein GAI-ASSOCIATED FACTOR 1-like [Mercurialis annua]